MKRVCPIHISFLDHAQVAGDDLEVAKIDLYGILFKEDKRAYYIASWITDGKIDHNSDCYVIVKHKDIKIRRLK